MTIQTINIGTAPNDNTGDDPRTAGQKLNSNFTTATHAASRDVGTGAGQLMEVGVFGLGLTEFENSPDLNTPLAGNGSSFRFVVNSTNSPTGLLSGYIIELGSDGTSAVSQVFISHTENRLLFRGSNSDSWLEVFQSGGFNHLQNTSGNPIASNSTTAGSNLTPAQSGTWLNATGSSIANNGYGLWIKQ